ncbi:MAG: UvrD-helicase domain-containing protein [Chitinophagaceae bacterium]|nr:UvrD-helicase domain-containing protein [Chitinophagaceae bacterium]
MKYLDELNEPQKEAVLHKDGPIMIIAGAGSGKTKVLTSRIAHLMGHHKVDSFNILALTFTNKAAAEMKERVERTLGNTEARNLYIGTFHSVFARILRSEAGKLGYPSNFTIYDTDDAKSVVKTVIHELALDDKHYKPNVVYNRISAAKNSLVGPAEYINDWALQQEDARANRPAIGQIYDAYAKRCFKNGAMDFDDLLFKMYLLLKNFPDSLSKYQRKFKYILIDEYQDTNPAQYEIIKLLGAMHENVCVVGDDAQSILNHYFNRDFAILYRTNAQSRSFEEALRRMGIAYRIYGGISFYQRKEVKDFIAYLRLVVNPQDEEALKRIINYPARGIGKTTLDKAVLFANEKELSLWDILCNASIYGFRSGTLEAIDGFVTTIKMFRSELVKKNAYDLAVLVGKSTNIVKELFNDKTTEGLARYENVQELLNSIKEFTETPMNEEDGEVGDKGLGSYLQQITLLTDADDDKDPDSDRVKLMTIHAAKGLEFPVVFVGGLEETLFPNAMSINTREELEEERRLFYVAITRAKQRLWLSFANARYRFGQLQQNDPSRFLEEIPEHYLERTYAGGAMKNSGSPFGSAFERMSRGFGGYQQQTRDPKPQTSKPSYINPVARPTVKEHVPSADFVASDTSNLQPGQKVEHQKFGFGEVLKMEGAAHNPIATVRFELNGEKKIMLNYARLRIVE